MDRNGVTEGEFEERGMNKCAEQVSHLALDIGGKLEFCLFRFEICCFSLYFPSWLDFVFYLLLSRSVYLFDTANFWVFNRMISCTHNYLIDYR